MELTYKILRDQQEYGPANLQQLQSWINEGRISAEMQVARSDQGVWRPAGQFEEFVWNSGPSATAAAPALDVNAEVRLALEKRLRSGADWFFWIAGLSVVNTVVALSGSEWGFILGLAVTQVIDAIGRGMGPTGVVIAVVLDLVIIGLFVFFGIFARKSKNWSFIVGMLLYAADASLSWLASDWLGLGFHVLALFFLFSGLKASQELKVVESRQAA